MNESLVLVMPILLLALALLVTFGLVRARRAGKQGALSKNSSRERERAFAMEATAGLRAKSARAAWLVAPVTDAVAKPVEPELDAVPSGPQEMSAFFATPERRTRPRPAVPAPGDVARVGRPNLDGVFGDAVKDLADALREAAVTVENAAIAGGGTSTERAARVTAAVTAALGALPLREVVAAAGAEDAGVEPLA